MTKSISRQFAMVAEGNHRGAGDLKNKNVPDGTGNITLSSSVAFLYRNKEKMLKDKKKSMLLSVLNGDKGLNDGVKNRLNSYGLFGKQSQHNPAKKFAYPDVETIFVYGSNITGYENNKLDDFIASIERSLGDTSATGKTHKTSPKYKEALEKAETMSVMVVGHYDEGFFSENEDDETIASLSLGYVKFGTGRQPIFSSFERPAGKDGLVESEWFGKKSKDYVFDSEGSVSLVTTRGFLNNFNGSGYENLRNHKNEDDGSSFWAVVVADYKPEDLSESVMASFSQETLNALKDVDKIRISYVMGERDTALIDSILTVKENGDAVLGFTGLIEDDIEDSKRIDFYTTQPDEEGNVRKYATLKARRGTFYTIKNK